MYRAAPTSKKYPIQSAVSALSWVGGEFRGERTHVNAWLSPFGAHLNLPNIVNQLHSNTK